MIKPLTNAALSALLGLLLTAAAQAASVMDDVRTLQQQWEQIKYQTAEEQQAERYAALAQQAQGVVKAWPQAPEALIWQGIILASQAGAVGGLDALDLCEQAKAVLEQALAIDAKALDGSAYTSLGSLYYQVPGWPLGFGDDDRARELLNQAVAINPNGIDSNYWLAAFLYDQGELTAARSALHKAQQAAPRPGRELADQGRRQEIAQLLATIDSKLN